MKTKKKKVREYTAFFEADERGGYTVTVPALPGLVTQRKDLEQARPMAKDAVTIFQVDERVAPDGDGGFIETQLPVRFLGA